MALYIECSSDPIIGLGNSFDKITQEYDPPSFWFRLEASASQKKHKECTADIIGMWNENEKWVNDFDPIKMFWLSEPTNDVRKEKLKHYTPTLYPQKSELIGFAHVKLTSKYRNPDFPIPVNNTPEHLVPELKLDCSSQENRGASKRMTFPYGIYYIQVLLMDIDGESISNIFKIHAFQDPKKCFIRHAYFYEKWKISWKDSLGMGVDMGTGLPKRRISRKQSLSTSEKRESNAFNKNEYRSEIKNILQKK